MKTEKETQAAKFLLGKLSDEEAEKIEHNYFNDKKLFEEILIVENDLIDAYAAGNLAPDDRVRFENRLLVNPKQRQRVKFAKTLVKYVSSLPTEEPKRSASESKWSSILAQLFSAKPLLSYSFAIAAFLFFAGAFWLAISNNSTQLTNDNELAGTQMPSGVETKQRVSEIQSPEEPASTEEQTSANEININTKTIKGKPTVAEGTLNANQNQSSTKRPIEPPQKPRTIISTIILPLGVTRSAGESKSFEIPAKANFVNLQLPPAESEFASFFAVLETVEGQQVWRGKAASKSVKNKNEKSITVTVPAQLLKKGDYIITIKGQSKDGAYEVVGDYSFTIDRQ